MRGLYARGRLIPEVVRARELLALLKAGAVDGLSIGFRTVKGRLDPRTRIRKLDAIDLWEISIVTFPLLAGARVRAVKAAAASPPPPHARTRQRLAGRSTLQRFKPERLFRREPRFRFARAAATSSWRDLVPARIGAAGARSMASCLNSTQNGWSIGSCDGSSPISSSNSRCGGWSERTARTRRATIAGGLPMRAAKRTSARPADARRVQYWKRDVLLSTLSTLLCGPGLDRSLVIGKPHCVTPIA